jgi:hypothetical protein
MPWPACIARCEDPDLVRSREPGGGRPRQSGVARLLRIAFLPVVTAAFAVAGGALPAAAAAPKVTSIRLVGDGGLAYRHTVLVVDRRNPAALARTAAFVPRTLPKLQRPEAVCNDCILYTLTIVRAGRSARLTWFNSPPGSLSRLLGALARNGRRS